MAPLNRRLQAWAQALLLLLLWNLGTPSALTLNDRAPLADRRFAWERMRLTGWRGEVLIYVPRALAMAMRTIEEFLPLSSALEG